jgi:hypothetical protein
MRYLFVLALFVLGMLMLGGEHTHMYYEVYGVAEEGHSHSGMGSHYHESFQVFGVAGVHHSH